MNESILSHNKESAQSAGHNRMLYRSHLERITPFALTLVFIILLAYFNLKLFENNYYTVFDLGLGYRLSYLFSTTFSPVNWPTPNFLVSAKPFTKMFYVVTGLSLLLYDSPETILLDQVTVVGLGSYAVFRITQIKTGNFGISIGMQLIYFLFPSTYGFMTQGGDFMVFLEGLLLLNYMFFLQRRFLLFTVTGILAVITNTWAPSIIIALYALEWIDRRGLRSILKHLGIVTVNIGHTLWHSFASLMAKKPSNGDHSSIHDFSFRGLKNKCRPYITPCNLALISVLAFSVLILFVEIHIYSLGGLIEASRVGTSTPSQRSTESYLDFMIGGSSLAKLTFIYGQLSPFVFTPLTTVFVLPVLIYFAVIILFTNYQPYYLPVEQYPFQYAAFLFISSAAFLGHVRNPGIAKKILVLLLVSSTFSFLIMSPFSLSNVASGQVGSELANSQLNDQIDYAYSLIPVHSSVFIQNDMPQLMNRQQVYMNGYYDNQTVDFAVINPLPLNNIAKAFGGFDISQANHFADNSSYGVYESVHGVIVYGLNYHKPPIFYIPAYYTSMVDATFAIGEYLPYDQYSSSFFTISPGRYNVSFELSSTTSAGVPHSFVFRVVTYNNNNNTLYATGISSPYSSSQISNTYVVNFSLVLPNFQALSIALYTLGSSNSQGNFTLVSVNVQQIGYLLS